MINYSNLFSVYLLLAISSQMITNIVAGDRQTDIYGAFLFGILVLILLLYFSSNCSILKFFIFFFFIKEKFNLILCIL